MKPKIAPFPAAYINGRNAKFGFHAVIEPRFHCPNYTVDSSLPREVRA